MKVTDFAGHEPRLLIEEYFAGGTQAWGLFEDRFGKPRREFTVDIDGAWDGQVLVLDERFLFSDGERDQRTWTIRKTAADRYEGRADDVVGIARGQCAGNALNWRYVMDMKVGDGRLRVTFNDWMFLQPSGVLLNRAYVSKLGIDVGSVTLAFMKEKTAPLEVSALFSRWPAVHEARQAANR